MQVVGYADLADLEKHRQFNDVLPIIKGMAWILGMLDKINEHWGWVGLKGTEIVGRNVFGNFIVLDENQAYWRICPEELTCEIVAGTPEGYL